MEDDAHDDTTPNDNKANVDANDDHDYHYHDDDDGDEAIVGST
jgi:hypothetical protein